MHSTPLDLPAVAQAGTDSEEGWLTANSTLLVGVVGILVSGLLGPSVASAWTGRRERQKDRRSLSVARRDDLRSVIDEVAVTLGGAVTAIRPLLAAQLADDELPKEPRDFLGSLNLLGQRLRLRLPGDDDVLLRFEQARRRLDELSEAIASKAQFDEAVRVFEAARDDFLDAGRAALEEIVAHGERGVA